MVVIDDSIVRGTTLKQSIIGILDRLHPKKIIIVSSSPQVRYPDYYGIDMSRMKEFIAFRAAIALLKERNMKQLIADVYQKCITQRNLPKTEMVNHVKEIYAPFTANEISKKIAELLTPPETKAEVQIVYQTLEEFAYIVSRPRRLVLFWRLSYSGRDETGKRALSNYRTGI